MGTDVVRVLVATPSPVGTLESLKAISDQIEIVLPERGDLHFLHPDFNAMIERTLDANPVDVLFADRLPHTWKPDGQLRWAQLAAAGTDWERGKPIWLDQKIVITNAVGIHTAAISEWVAAMLLLHSRSVLQVADWKKQRRWTLADVRPPSSILLGKTVGILGYGAIGHEVARMARALGMKVIAFNRSGIRQLQGRYDPPRLAQRLAMADDEVDLRSVDQLDAALPDLDYLVLAASLNTSSTHLIGAEQLAKLKPSAYLINIARGGLLDESALIAALEAGQLSGAALDVFEKEPPAEDSPLFDLPNTVVSPHSSGGFDDYYGWAHELFRVNMKRFLAGEPLVNVVDRVREN